MADVAQGMTDPVMAGAPADRARVVRHVGNMAPAASPGQRLALTKAILRFQPQRGPPGELKVVELALLLESKRQREAEGAAGIDATT